MTSKEFTIWLDGLLHYVQTSEMPNNVDNKILHTIWQKLKDIDDSEEETTPNHDWDSEGNCKCK